MSVEILNLAEIIPKGVMEMYNPKLAEMVLADIADGAYNEWIRIAGKALSTSRQAYLDGLQPVAMKPGAAVISLVGVLPNAIEEGQAAYDMHETLLGPNVPISPPGEYGKHLKIDPKTFKTGYYRAIPFRHATPGSKQAPRGGVVGVEMGKAYTGHKAVEDAKALGKKVYNKAKRLKGTVSEPYGKTAYGGRLPEGLAPKLKPHHKTDIYAGMIKERKTYEKSRQSQYMTFRMISTGSPGWRRKKTVGKFFAAQVSQYVQKIAPQTFAALVEGMGE
jgi:hypothetical protein